MGHPSFLRLCSLRRSESDGGVPLDPRVERQAEVRPDHLDVDLRLPAQAVPPIHQSVALRIHGSLPDGTGPRLAQGPPESATATARSTLTRNLRTRAPDPASSEE